jgi:Adenylate kinase and related kinases
VNRVAVIGSGGSGKSTLSRELGRRTGLPVIHLDHLYWRPGWIEPPEDEWQATHAQLIAGEQWIIDGNYGSTMEPRLAVADTVIFLDLPRLVCMWSVLRRLALAGRNGRPNQVPGLSDRLDRAFLLWIWRYPANRRPEILRRLASLPETTQVVQIRSRREIREFLDDVTLEPAA